MCLGAIEKNTGSGWVEDKRLVEEVYGFLVAARIDEQYRLVVEVGDQFVFFGICHCKCLQMKDN